MLESIKVKSDGSSTWQCYSLKNHWLVWRGNFSFVARIVIKVLLIDSVIAAQHIRIAVKCHDHPQADIYREYIPVNQCKQLFSFFVVYSSPFIF